MTPEAGLSISLRPQSRDAETRPVDDELRARGPLMGSIQRANAHRVRCQRCVLSGQCFPSGVTDHELEALDRIVVRGPTLGKGSILFRAGEPPTSLFIIRSGALRSFARDATGIEQTVGFHLPGEFVGLPALHDDCYEMTAEALQATAVCELPFAELELVSSRVPAMRRHLLRLLSRELQHNQAARLALSTSKADVRVAMFISQYRARLEQRGLSTTRFRLPMSRRELANHLGLAVETVSRSLSTMRTKGAIEIHGKEVEIVEPERLRKIAAVCPLQRRQ